VQGKSAEELAPRYKQALDAGLAALQAELAAATDSMDDARWGPMLDALEPIRVWLCCFVSCVQHPGCFCLQHITNL
jgi:hypothetical protein